MDLKDFVRETLLSTHDGVSDTIHQLDVSKGAGTVNPYWMGADANWKKHVEKIEFDVAVTATDKAEGTGKAGIKVFSVTTTGVEGSKSFENSTISKIRFSIPMIFPASARYARTPKQDKPTST